MLKIQHPYNFRNALVRSVFAILLMVIVQICKNFNLRSRNVIANAVDHQVLTS